MAIKSEMAQEILGLEPSNTIALNSGAKHGELAAELTATRRRKSAKDRSNALPCDLRYRMELNEQLSWKLFRQDTNEPVCSLKYGPELPTKGSVVKVDSGCAVVSTIDEGLGILAGDLEMRETFDVRRIYTTPNGTSVAFKRIESGRTVLWSYKAAGEIMIGPHVKFGVTERKAQPTARTQKRMTQKILAAYVISQDPETTPKQLTATLQLAFPQAAISDRHGPHYLSLSRNGKLPEPPDDDPRTW